MKIIGISGGGKNGNNDAMCREALKAAKEMGAEVEFIRLLDLDLKPCNGCIACVGKIMQGKNPQCIIKDDFPWLDEKMLEADGVIFAMPIFEKGAPAVFKIIQDRFAGPSHDRGMLTVCRMISQKTGNEGPDARLFRDDKFLSFMSIGGSDWATRVSADMRLFALVPMWKTIDEKVFVWSKGIVTEDEKVQECHQVGVNMVKALKDPANAKFMGDPGVCPHCNSRNFYLENEAAKAVCEVCGIIGEIKVVDGKIKFEFPEEQLKHAHDTLSGKLIHVDDIKRNEGALVEAKKSAKYADRMAGYKTFLQASLPAGR